MDNSILFYIFAACYETNNVAQPNQKLIFIMQAQKERFAFDDGALDVLVIIHSCSDKKNTTTRRYILVSSTSGINAE